MAIFQKLKAKLFGTNPTKYDQGLKKSRTLFASKIRHLTARYHEVNEQYFEELEEILIAADVGYKMAMTIIAEIRYEAKIAKLKTPSEVNELLIDKMFVIYTDGGVVSTRLQFAKKGLSVFLIIGVNGNGKTTSVAKLAYKLKSDGKRPLLIAADTFRAGAVEQLKQWAEKIEIDIHLPISEKQDPATVVFQGLAKAVSEGYDIALIDTAGRLENKINLMQELAKINKVVYKQVNHQADEIFLVIDATTGQNGIIQAQEFAKSIPISSIILTKMDGSSKGGIILAIKEYLDLPVKLVGIGEKAPDLIEFDLEQYLYSLTKNIFDNEVQNNE